MTSHENFMRRAFEQARKSAGEGGVPVGACLVVDGKVIAEGHNRRVQERNVILHGETDCMRQAGLFTGWSRATMYTTLSPCMMCTGTIIQFGIRHVVIGDARNFGGSEVLLREHGVEVTVLDMPELVAYFGEWQRANEALWNGDIGR